MHSIVKKSFMSFLGLATALFVASPAIAAQGDREDVRSLSMITEERMRDTALPEQRVAVFASLTPKARPIEFTPEWLDDQPRATGDDEWRCLAEALYFEARGETVQGQFAVAEVIFNRIRSSRFPQSACGVINQGTGKKYQCQFTYTCDGKEEIIREKRAFDRVGKVARAVLDGLVPNLTEGATHYHTRSVNPAWARVYTRTTSIGSHIFYRHTWKTASN